MREPSSVAIVTATAEPAPDLQAAFESLPAPGVAGWTGADSDVSVVVKGGPTGRRTLWIFADTFVAGYNGTSHSRLLPWHMPHNTVALAPCSATACAGTPTFFWRRDPSGAPASAFFSITGGKASEILWPVAALASRDGSAVLLLAQRDQAGSLNVSGTTAISLHVGDGEDPSAWDYSTSNVGTQQLTWFSSIFFAQPTGDDDTVYLFGHDGRTGEGALRQPRDKTGLHAPTVLARSRLGALLEHDWSGLEYWSDGGGWAPTPAALLPLGVPSWETTVHWSAALSRWYTFELNWGALDMWTASQVTGPWAKTPAIFRVPAPFNGTAVPGTGTAWLCYAAKAHPETLGDDANSRAGKASLALSYVCNTWGGGPGVLNEEIYQTGGMAMAPVDIRGYWPKFLKVKASLVG
jgi:hypothetical protein